MPSVVAAVCAALLVAVESRTLRVIPRGATRFGGRLCVGERLGLGPFSQPRRHFYDVGRTSLGSVKAYVDPSKLEKFTWQILPPGEKIEPKEDKVREAMASFPIIGLFMQLASADGGLEGGQLRFSEFARRILDNVSPQFYKAVEALRSFRGPEITFSTCSYALWTAAYGAGLVDRDQILDTNRRLAISRDLEYEMAMYDNVRSSAVMRSKQRGEEVEQLATLEDQVELSVDSLARLLQIKKGKDIPEGIAEHVATLVSECFPSAKEDTVMSFIETHAVRTGAAPIYDTAGDEEDEENIEESQMDQEQLGELPQK